MSAGPYHTPVLLDETLSFLLPVRHGVLVDATVGGGGHTEALLRQSTGVRVVGIDADADAIAYATDRLRPFGDRFIPVRENFVRLRTILERLDVFPSAVFFDLGVSSFQLDRPEKGFRFGSDAPLDMRLDASQQLRASEVIATYSAERLEEVFRTYGEERHARRLARAIVRERSVHAVTTSGELSSIVERVVGRRFLIKSLARVFQALRIEVNDELERLKIALRDATELLPSDGRIVVISYHSLEDRVVKTFFKEAAATSIPSGSKLVPDMVVAPRLEILTGKPVVPSQKEQRNNPRSRSAKLRAARKN